MSTYTHDDLKSMALDTGLVQVMGLAHSGGSMAAYGAQVDRFNAFRAACHPTGSLAFTVASEEAILRAIIDTIQDLWDVFAQVEMSLKDGAPTLAALMERDILVALISTLCVFARETAKEYGSALADSEGADTPEPEDKSSNPFAALLHTLAGKGSTVAQKAMDSVEQIVGDVTLVGEQAASLSRSFITSSPWYAVATAQLASSLGSNVTVPDTLPKSAQGWTP